MKLARYSEEHYTELVGALDRRAEPDPAVAGRVEKIVAEVRNGGDQALLELTGKFGGPAMTPAQLPVTRHEMEEALEELPKQQREALNAARKNVRDFARRSRRKNWKSRNRQGARVGEWFDPFQRVGIYVPGGTAPLVSSALMTVTLAETVGVEEIVVTTPPDAAGGTNPALLAALQLAGATEVWRVGGAQAIAALAHGTESIRPVQKIFGPGNAYVVEAKRQAFGKVAIDLLPGPSEIAVLADTTARADWVAADLLAQAEHGEGSLMVLITTSEKLLAAVVKEVARQKASLSRGDHLDKVLQAGAFGVLVRDLTEGVDLVNRFAPEHLSVVTDDAETWARKVRTAGAIFLGPWSPVAAGDFLAGPSHELPTGGAGKSFAGLTVDQFQRRTSLVEFDKAALKKSRKTLQCFSEVEGLDAHGRSVSIRFDSDAD